MEKQIDEELLDASKEQRKALLEQKEKLRAIL